MIAYIAMSLDGYIADKDGKVDWLEKVSSPEITEEYNRFYNSIDNVIMGSTTYEQILGFDIDYPYEDKMNYILTFEKEKYTQMPNRKFISIDDIPSELENERTWVVGGSIVINNLIRAKKIDKFQIAIIPTVLGNGLRLFNDVNITELVLDNVKQFGSVVELTYSVKK